MGESNYLINTFCETIPAGGRVFDRQDPPDILPDHVTHPKHPAVECVGLRVEDAGWRVEGGGWKGQGSGFRVQGAGCRVQGAHPKHPADEGSWFKDRYSSQLKDNHFAEM